MNVRAEGGRTQKLVLSMPEINAETDNACLFLKEFARLVNERTNGMIEINVFGGGQLGNEAECIEGLANGTYSVRETNAAGLVDHYTLDVTEGSIVLDGMDITNVSGRELRRVYAGMQMVFQTPTDSFDPRRTLGDGIGESLRNNGWSRKDTKDEVARLLEVCGLSPDFASRYPHQVSGGQCQRAAIARALAIRPKLLICDEATSALDVTIQQEIIALLSDLRWTKGTDLSILFICHDIALVQQFCSRVLVMYKGDIVEQGDPNVIIRNPKDPYTKRLIDSIL